MLFSTANILVASATVAVSFANPLQFADSSCAICVDDVNDCQQMYGGCYDFCAEPRKEFDIPECKGVSGKKQVCEYFKNECGERYGGCYPAEGPVPGWAAPACPPNGQTVQPDESCRICVDQMNDCQQMYGGCYDFCAEPRKEFEIPECKGVSGKKTVCEYFKNDCDKVYGGCYPEEGPIPGWAEPTCPAEEAKPAVSE
ncbi:hypothetical protein Slin15195_G125910 [Septoria linicola]|uniref:Uncharacterized protein n=1 Tax=Septoria linicola TaxID=215465 RepID=A0A9Q9B068_9PEZI|nr:hypothetical protein Slin14017_G082090 [Septoria linicola]USW59272.1 hypothetical protein Slin15195_G125910 [Septoria linicola]